MIWKRYLQACCASLLPFYVQWCSMFITSFLWHCSKFIIGCQTEPSLRGESASCDSARGRRSSHSYRWGSRDPSKLDFQECFVSSSSRSELNDRFGPPWFEGINFVVLWDCGDEKGSRALNKPQTCRDPFSVMSALLSHFGLLFFRCFSLSALLEKVGRMNWRKNFSFSLAAWLSHSIFMFRALFGSCTTWFFDIWK